jgi:hypothetical protein
MRRVIGIDIHRTFGEVVIWEDGRLRNFGRVDMTPDRARRAWREAASDRRSGNLKQPATPWRSRGFSLRLSVGS